MQEITREELLELISVVKVDGKWVVEDVVGNVWGNVGGNVKGNVWGDVEGYVFGKVKNREE